jgi:DNA end-binding protein Ku
MIRAKQKNLVKSSPAAAKRSAAKPTGNVVNIREALKKSLAKDNEGPKSI